MRIKFRFMLLGAVAMLLTGFSIPDEELELDGVERSRITDVSYSFQCAKLRVRVGYRMTHLDPDEIPLRQAMRADLSKLSVSDRRINSAGLEEARRLFGNFAFVERVEARCYRGAVDLWVVGLPLQPWLDFLEGRLSERPRTTVGAIDIAPDGTVTIRK